MENLWKCALPQLYPLNATDASNTVPPSVPSCSDISPADMPPDTFEELLAHCNATCTDAPPPPEDCYLTHPYPDGGDSNSKFVNGQATGQPSTSSPTDEEAAVAVVELLIGRRRNPTAPVFGGEPSTEHGDNRPTYPVFEDVVGGIPSETTSSAFSSGGSTPFDTSYPTSAASGDSALYEFPAETPSEASPLFDSVEIVPPASNNAGWYTADAATDARNVPVVQYSYLERKMPTDGPDASERGTSQFELSPPVEISLPDSSYFHAPDDNQSCPHAAEILTPPSAEWAPEVVGGQDVSTAHAAPSVTQTYNVNAADPALHDFIPQVDDNTGFATGSASTVGHYNTPAQSIPRASHWQVDAMFLNMQSAGPSQGDLAPPPVAYSYGSADLTGADQGFPVDHATASVAGHHLSQPAMTHNPHGAYNMHSAALDGVAYPYPPALSTMPVFSTPASYPISDATGTAYVAAPPDPAFVYRASSSSLAHALVDTAQRPTRPLPRRRQRVRYDFSEAIASLCSVPRNFANPGSAAVQHTPIAGPSAMYSQHAVIAGPSTMHPQHAATAGPSTMPLVSDHQQVFRADFTEDDNVASSSNAGETDAPPRKKRCRGKRQTGLPTPSDLHCRVDGCASEFTDVSVDNVINRVRSHLTQVHQYDLRGKHVSCRWKGCDADPMDGTSIVRHVQSVHLRISFPCPYQDQGCPLFFSRKDECHRHMNKTHRKRATESDSEI